MMLMHVQFSLGDISPEWNEEYSKAFFDFFQKKLNIPGDRGYMYTLSLLPGIGRI
jgi:hypothetical protein